MHDYEQNLALDFIKTCLVWNFYLLGFGLNVHHVLMFLVFDLFLSKVFYVFVFVFSFDMFLF
jgi:hypothetical protein